MRELFEANTITFNNFSINRNNCNNDRRYYEEITPFLGREQADERFGALLADADWDTLPAAVRRRFGRKVKGGGTISYVGQVTECRMSRLGWAVAQAARLIGGPLPLRRDVGVAAAVNVTEDEAGGGQFWLRHYSAHHGFPQTIKSIKRFAGPTGIEEYLGYGLGIALSMGVKNGVLVFKSTHYFLCFGTRRLRLPRWLTLGELTIGHQDCGDGWFAFTLDLRHRRFHELIHQRCMFTELSAGHVR